MNRILLLLFALVSLSVSAQDTTAVVQLPVLKFGYLSYDSAIHAVPGYALVQQSMNDLRAQYEAEQKRAEQDFNLKYEEFLEGQRDFPETILRKRQTELKELLASYMHKDMIYREGLIGFADSAKLTAIRKYGRLLSQEYREDGIYVCAYLPKEMKLP